MHKSKLAGFIIDCQTHNLSLAADFWSQALGMQKHEFDGEEGQRYVKLVDARQDLQIEVQAVEHDSRVHLDIEADDIQAEVARLETLGATKVGEVKSWCVMQAPTGQRFCVIQKASADFDRYANTWSE